MTEAMTGCSRVFHCDYGNKGPRAEKRAITVDGSLNVLAVSRKLGVESTVYLSSAAVWGYDPPFAAIDESTPYPEGLDGYCRDKQEAEKRVLEFARPGMLPRVAVLLPTLVYGPYSPFVMDTIERMRSGQFGLPPDPGFAYHVFVDDLAEAIIAAAEIKIDGAEKIIVTDPEPEPFEKFFSRFSTMVASGKIPVVEAPAAEAAGASEAMTLARALQSEELRKLITCLPGSRAVYGLARRIFPGLARKKNDRPLPRLDVSGAVAEPFLNKSEWIYYNSKTRISGAKAARLLASARHAGIGRGMAATHAWLKHLELAL